MSTTDSLPAPPASQNEAGSFPPLDALVRQHTDFVYAAAVRQVRDPHVAADVTQAVFLILQQKLPALGKETILSAWLLRTTRYTCLAALHQARRRRHHEQKAATMRAESQPAAVPDEWSQSIDAAMLKLGNADRTALAAVYFEGLSHKQIADRLGISEATARKRAQRAVEKLRKILGTRARRDLSALALTSALGLMAKPAAAPAAVVSAVSASLAGNIPTAVSTLVKGTLFLIKVMKMKTTAIMIAIACALGLGGIAAYQKALAQQPLEPLVPVAAPASPTPAARNPLASPDTGGAAFGPVKTMTISAPGGPSANYYGDLDTGKVSDPTQQTGRFTNTAGMLTWLGRQGFDLSFRVIELVGYEMAVQQVANRAFDEETPDQLMNVLYQIGPAVFAGMSATTVPATYCFRTREGGVGILELTKVNASSIELRYKLLDPKVRDILVAQRAASKLLPDLEKQLQYIDTAQANNDKARLSSDMKNLAFQATGLAEYSRGTPWAARTQLVASMAQLARDLLEQPNPNLKVGTDEIRQTLATVASDLNKAANTQPTQPSTSPASRALP